MSTWSREFFVAVSFIGCLSLSGQTSITTLTQLQDCMNATPSQTYYNNLTTAESLGYSSANICQLMPNTYTVSSTLSIGRSNIFITGTVSGGAADTTLRRNSSSLTYIMQAGSSSITGVTISYLTFDGNRYGFGTAPGSGYSTAPNLSCLAGNAFFFDLELSTSGGSSGTFTVEWVDFINAPGTALQLSGYGSSVSTSTFGNGGYGYGPAGSLGTESAAQTATRSTAVWLDGPASSSTCSGSATSSGCNGAYYNFIAYAGTAAINLNGVNQTAYGNLLQSDRYEISDGSGGGQLSVGGSTYSSPAGAFVGANVINGDYWPAQHYLSPFTAAASGCSMPSTRQYNSGVEAYGSGHVFENNEIEQNSGSGLQFGGSNPTGQITINATNHLSASDPPRLIESNQAGGIVFLGSPSWTYSVDGVTLTDVLVQNNALYGVAFQGTTNYSSSSYTGFTNDACISGNSSGAVSANSATTLTYASLPTSPTNDYWIYNYANSSPAYTCPTSGDQTPAPSYITGWPW